MVSEIERLLQIYQNRMERSFADAPPGLIEELVPSLGPPSVEKRQLEELQAELPVNLPSSFAAYLTGPLVENGLEWAEIVLPSNDSLESVRSLLLQRDLWPLQLIQFADGPSGDPVCFDFARSESTDSELSVVVINHDWATPEDWTDASQIRKLVSAQWPAFIDLLRAICEGHNITYKNPEGA